MKQVWKLFLLLILTICGLSFTPDAIRSDAEGTFHNVVGIEIDVDTDVFSGPIKLDYNDYKWFYVFQEGDTVSVYIHVSPLLLGSNEIRYRFSKSTRDFDDLPGREQYKKLSKRTELKSQSELRLHEHQQ